MTLIFLWVSRVLNLAYLALDRKSGMNEIATGDGIRLKPKKPFQETKLEDVSGCLHYEGKPKTLDELDNAIRQGVLEQWQ